MRVIIITAMYPPNRTGTSFYSKNLASTLSNHGCSVEIITTKNDDPSYVEENTSFKVHRIPALHMPLKNYFKHLRFCSLIPGNYIRIKKIIKKFDPDFVLLINHYLDIAFPAIYAASVAGAPLYISIGTQLQSLNRFRHKILRFLDRLIIGNLIFPKALKIISWDKEIERYLKDVHNKKNVSKSVIIPFGVNGNLDYYKRNDYKYEASSQILGVGAIIDHRNYLYQIRVFNKLLKTFPNLTLKIIGNIYIDKPVKLVQQLGIEDHVIFTGELPHDEVLEEYNRSSLHWMMLSGEYVGLGTSTIEAMLIGVPAISNIPENLFGLDLLHDMVNYIHTDGVNIENDCIKITSVLTDQNLRKTIGNNGKNFVQKYMNWDLVAENYIHYFSLDSKN